VATAKRHPATARTWIGALAWATILAGSVAACTRTGPHDAEQKTTFEQPPVGGTLTYRVHTAEPLDLIIWFANGSSEPARLRAIDLPSADSHIRVIGTSIYNVKRVGYNPATALGLLSKECPRHFSPRPLSSLVVPGHGKSPWFAAVVLRVTKPGKYSIQNIKLIYSIGTQRYWQYYGDSVSLTVSNPAKPSLTPLPPSAVC
jgi:hypothetical protein